MAMSFQHSPVWRFAVYRVHMRILFLSHYFPPEVNAPASRTFEHCREWVREGHDVTVVTCAPNHPRGKVFEGYRNRLFQREVVDGVKVIRIWSYLSANRGVRKRSLNYLSYLFSSILLSPFFPRADIVISTSPQFFNGLAGYVIGKIKRAPWLLEIRDLWPDSIREVDAMKDSWVLSVLERLEGFAYRKANEIVPVTHAFKEYMIGKGIDAAKIDVITNGANLALFTFSDDGGKSLRQSLGLGNRFVAAYVGTHGMAHHLETVLEAAARLRDVPEIVFLMVGDGARKEALRQKKEEMGLDNVVMVDQLPKERMPEIWALTDASLVLLKKTPVFETVIPSKIFESMAMQRPIVLGVRGESQRIIEQSGAGICIEPESGEALAEAVLTLYRSPQLRSEMGEKGREAVEQHYNRAVLARRYLDVMNKTVYGRALPDEQVVKLASGVDSSHGNG